MHSFDLDEEIDRYQNQIDRLKRERFEINLAKERQAPLKVPKDTWSMLEVAQYEVLRASQDLVHSNRSYSTPDCVEVDRAKLQALVSAVEQWNKLRIQG